MVQLMSVYRRDYRDPRFIICDDEKLDERRVNKPSEEDQTNCDEVCNCGKSENNQLSEDINKQNDIEWTGIQQLGRLITPAIIGDTKGILNKNSVNNSIQQNDTQNINDQNKVGLVLQKCYPDLYERLLKMEQNESSQKQDEFDFTTTYQTDFVDYSRNPSDNDETNNKMKDENECDEFKNDKIKEEVKKIMECQDVFPGKPAEGRISDSMPETKDKSKGVSNLEIELTSKKKPIISEYRDVISRTGCIIMKNQIHDHKNCAKICNHQLIDSCHRYK